MKMWAIATFDFTVNDIHELMNSLPEGTLYVQPSKKVGFWEANTVQCTIIWHPPQDFKPPEIVSGAILG